MPEDGNIQMQHTKLLAELDSKVSMFEKVFSLNENLHNTLVTMAGDNKAILLRLEQQGEDLKAMVSTLKAHEERFDIIEEKMSSKETVQKLYEKVDNLEKKDGRNAEKLLGQIKWLLVSLIVGAIFALVWSVILGATP
jgi:hypothetical protein